jgi:hypothetical protein
VAQAAICPNFPEFRTSRALGEWRGSYQGSVSSSLLSSALLIFATNTALSAVPNSRRLSSQLPRHPLPEGRGNGLRPRYRYYAPELTEWMLGR